MNFQLSAEEVRVLGALIEKRITTPDYYPLSLNSLTNACNQKSNREPVVTYNEKVIEDNIESLRSKKFVRKVEDGGRVPKYKENFTEDLKLNAQETAVLCSLMLRGPQTAGEIRNRSGRLYEFKTIEEIEEVLQILKEREDGPYVIKLERQQGFKERRFAHLLSGEPVIENQQTEIETEDKIANLEQELEKLRNDFEALKVIVIDLKEQLE